ncbi:transglutaminase domain-containing protein [Bacteroides salyersiae]|uniref:transglutaminase domain-containing protein n=1 Tax=Bacteroides salyersiae TaxID=291644 RepID=UPI00189A1A53|nr:transglutaminase-like domain-containing protein [Bacteroides salyersiae]
MRYIQTSVKYNNIIIRAEDSSIIIDASSSSLKKKDFMVFSSNEANEEICKKTYSTTSIIRYSVLLLQNGIYSLNLLVRKGTENIYWSYFHKNDILFSIQNGQLDFKSSPILIGNNSRLTTLTQQSHFIDDSLKCSIDLQVADSKIRTLAYNISKGLLFDYAKVLAVHDWVAENIYYDLDTLRSGQYRYNDVTAVGTLTAKKGVCQGISNLSIALLRSMGIPAYGLTCFALGVSTTGDWGKQNNLCAPANHQITIAYVDKRWIIMDITWDSDNIFENGEYRQKTGLGVSHKYFDSTVPFISNTHRFTL